MPFSNRSRIVLFSDESFQSLFYAGPEPPRIVHESFISQWSHSNSKFFALTPCALGHINYIGVWEKTHHPNRSTKMDTQIALRHQKIRAELDAIGDRLEVIAKTLPDRPTPTRAILFGHAWDIKRIARTDTASEGI